MVKTATSNHVPEEEEYDGEDLTPTTTDASSHRDGKGTEQKAHNSRSKHSETEQRRRSKINERCCVGECDSEVMDCNILKDLIPPNDQKRDKASLLLEVIEYIQFLQEKIQMYEGSYQGWNQEPTKLIPRRSSNGVGENLADHSQSMTNCSGYTSNVGRIISYVQSSSESDYGAQIGLHHTPGPAMSLLPSMNPCERSISPAENVTAHHQSRASHALHLLAAECNIAEDAASEHGRAQQSCSSSISSVYSQGVLKSLTQALQASGVDLSPASISVQLDVGEISSNQIATSSSVQHPGNLAFTTNHHVPSDSMKECDGKDSSQAAKRIRTA